MAISFVLMISIWLRNLAKRFGQPHLIQCLSMEQVDKIKGFGLGTTKKQIHLMVTEGLQPRTTGLQA